MNNRVAFIDFVRGLLNINPLERWSPHQAKLHPFITQQKFTGPFVPPMNLKSSSLNRSPAPGTQQQIQAEALSKQRAQAAQAQANSVAQGAYATASMPSPQQYAGPPQPGHAQNPQQMYNNNMYSPGGMANQPPPYGAGQPNAYGQIVMAQAPQQMSGSQYASQPQQNVYGQANAQARRQRASTMEQQQSGIPAAIQRVASHLDPNAPIRLQPSPAYYPPPADGSIPSMGMESTPGRAGRRGSRIQAGARGNRDFIRNLEERTMEEGYMSGQPQQQQQQQPNPWH